MEKKKIINLLCIGTLCGALVWGCGRTQPEGIEEASNVGVEKILIEDVESLTEGLAFDIEAPKEEIFTKIKDKIEARAEEEAEAGSVTVNEELLGTWSVTFDYAAVIERELSSEFADFHEDFDLTIYLTFRDDGTFEMYADEEELGPALQNYLESLARFATDYTYEEFREGLGEYYSEEEFEEIIYSQFGMSLYDSMMEQFTDIITAEDLAEEMYTNGVYKVSGNQLYMDEDVISPFTYDIFTIEGDTLTLTPPEDAEVEPTGIEGFDYPYVFTRVTE